MISGFERGKGPPEKRFMVDIMLGKLARWLRILGFDTLYGPLAGPWDILCRSHRGVELFNPQPTLVRTRGRPVPERKRPHGTAGGSGTAAFASGKRCELSQSVRGL